jgi:hypothetical protein
MLRLMFQAFEDLTALRQHGARKVAHALETEHLFGALLWEPDESGLQRWRRLSERVTRSWRLLDHTVQTNRLDPLQFQEAYRQLLSLRMAWARLEPQSQALPLIDRIIDHMRQLLIGHAQDQEPHTGSQQ